MVISHTQELNKIHAKGDNADGTYEVLEYTEEGIESNNKSNLALTSEEVDMSVEMKTIWNLLKNMQNRQNIHQNQGNQQNAINDQQNQILSTPKTKKEVGPWVTTICMEMYDSREILYTKIGRPQLWGGLM